MNNWKKYTLAALVVTAAGFAYLNSSHRNIPADFRDAVADKGFDTTMPIIDKEKGDVPVPKAAVPVKTSNIPSAKKLTAAEQKAAWAKMRDKGELTDEGYNYLLEMQKVMESMVQMSAVR
ncbi:MAG TPA: hypothetical protein DEF68_07825 [Elusimicrobia bacterium]|nr:hypothetical protein [Elusimicrobiota bacterium]